MSKLLIEDNVWTISDSDLWRYARPSEETVFPLEYAFHLLGAVNGKTIVDLGCGGGLNTVTLARLGAHVFAIDTSDRNLEIAGERAYANGVHGNVTLLQSDGSVIPVGDHEADHVFCSAIVQQNDPIIAGRHIRRVLRPGGTVVFNETLYSPVLLAVLDGFRPPDTKGWQNGLLTPALADAISRAVGRTGRRKEFWLTMPLLARMGINSRSRAATVSQRVDATLLRHFPRLRQFASHLVWEARKEI